MNNNIEDKDADKQQTSYYQKQRLARLSDTYWTQWFDEFQKLAENHGIITSDDADLWWDDCGAGKTPRDSMDGFLASDEGAEFRYNIQSEKSNIEDPPKADEWFHHYSIN